jgi:molecular chaperone DnaJ
MDLYVILGLKRTASPADIKRAYRRLARKYHPDINPGDRAAGLRFRQIAEAHEILIDPVRRRRYDESGAVGAPEPSESVGFEGFDFSVESVEGPRASTFGDLFADVFQRGFQTPADHLERGADLHTHIEVSFDEAIRGADRHLTVTHLAACAGCGGSGAVRTPDARCLYCSGTGSIRSGRGHMIFTRSCPHCGGSGRQRQASCGRCSGVGVETRTEAMLVRVPAGTADGARLRLAGKGHCGRKGGVCGDLYVTVQVLPHPLFRREGDDLLLQVPVAVHEAALGTKIDVPTLEGAARLRIPPGTQSGQRFRLRERGVPSRDGRKGDLIVELRVVLPRLLDERSKELLREFGRINVEDVRVDWLSGRRGN